MKMSSWAIKSAGPITMKNTCFQSNDFLREAPIVAVNSLVLSTNNYVDRKDDNLACGLFAVFESDDALQQLSNFVCLDPRSRECRAQIPGEIFAVGPETETPESSAATESPVSSPTVNNNGSEAPVSSAGSVSEPPNESGSMHRPTQLFETCYAAMIFAFWLVT